MGGLAQHRLLDRLTALVAGLVGCLREEAMKLKWVHTRRWRWNCYDAHGLDFPYPKLLPGWVRKLITWTYTLK